MKLNTVKPADGATKARKRVGRGPGKGGAAPVYRKHDNRRRQAEGGHTQNPQAGVWSHQRGVHGKRKRALHPGGAEKRQDHQRDKLLHSQQRV